MPQVSPVRNAPPPRLMGTSHIFTIAGFSKPAGVTVDGDGYLYVADHGKSEIIVVNSDGKRVESIGRFGWREGEFDRPADVALDAQLRLYIADSGNNRLQRFSLVNRDFGTVVGSTALLLNEPQGVATDIRGYIYIADTWNHRILKVDPLGRLQMEIGGPGLFSRPQSVMVDASDNIYVSDTGNHRIQKLDFSGSQVAIWGEEGTGKGQFRNPAGISHDRFRNIYIADQGNHRIQVLSPDGGYLAEFGQQFLDDPVDVAIDRDLHVYVTDMSAGDIEVFRMIYEMAEGVRKE